MKTLSIDDLYDYQFSQAPVPDGEEYSNFKGLGFIKNLFPAHTFVGGLLGSTNHSKGIELGGLFGGGHKKHHSKPKPQVIYAQPPAETKKKKDHTKTYMMIGGGVLLLIIVLMFVFMHKK